MKNPYKLILAFGSIGTSIFTVPKIYNHLLFKVNMLFEGLVVEDEYRAKVFPAYIENFKDQNFESDSDALKLQNELKEAGTDTEIAVIYNKIGKFYYNENDYNNIAKLSFFYETLTMLESTNLSSPLLYAEVSGHISDVYYSENNKKLGDRYKDLYDTTLLHLEEEKKYKEIALIHKNSNNYGKSISYFHKALQIDTNNKETCDIYKNLHDIYLILKDDQNSFKYSAFLEVNGCNEDVTAFSWPFSPSIIEEQSEFCLAGESTNEPSPLELQ